MAGWHPNTLILKENTPTMALQPLLPRLPVPDLDETMEVFLRTLEPLLTNAEMQHMRVLVADFVSASGPGRRLQASLEAREAAMAESGSTDYPTASWLEGWFDAMAYLTDRTPLPTNVNVFGTLFECVQHPDPLWKGALIVRALLEVKRQLDTDALQPDCLGRGGQLPLCMFQFRRVFGITRVPGDPMDEFLVAPSDTRHIVVLCHDHLFPVTVYRPDGAPLSTADIALQLTRVRDAARRLPRAQHAVATATYQRRDEWAQARDDMQADALNAASLAQVESALFAVVLTDAAPTTPSELMRLCEHGDGHELWCDKSFNIVVCANGCTGFNGEHGCSDAPVPQRVLHEMFKYSGTLPQSAAEDAPADASLPTPAPLGWNFSPALSAFLSRSAQVGRALADEAQTVCGRFDTFGRGWLRERKLGPDSFMQMALQLAFWRDQGRQTSVYESATTRTFLHGRTECIRSLSNESRAFVTAMEDPSIGNVTREELLRKAIHGHQMFTQKCMIGMGVDRHLMGLRMTAYEAGEEQHPLFTVPPFVKANTWELSTSQMAYQETNYPGFGAPFLGEGMPTSYGCCYVVSLKDKLLFTVTSRASDPTKDAARFALAIKQALTDIAAVVAANEQARL